ncbi:MAG: GNAT family N-acetyltransferase [Verrucomicrobia bacterium]|nr:GNAT family N-acetyltransferase [Chloroflexota bacterium]MBU1694459.1 GNAT family N-acetyltransferase [Verrucomicrobiota bacterium]MBU1880034.1 GNAT family N-acetyltransferase [Chloroflexota bacterium]
MQFRFKPMNEIYAHAIANWHYEGIYAFYDMDQDIKDREELLDPHNWTGKYYAVVDERGELVGFFCFEKEGEAVVIGCGLRPDCTGKGLGQAFIEAGLEYAEQELDPATFRLIVATFNQRAIRVYEQAGFKPDGVFMNETNGGQYEFLRMVR